MQFCFECRWIRGSPWLGTKLVRVVSSNLLDQLTNLIITKITFAISRSISLRMSETEAIQPIFR